ncbi:thrombospondin type 3 repeat-containing protein [Pseudoalteromonas tunicata]|uniref:thrombospondin type 3 repeat-containing protein n=1 Tax=Pseudoalteromonas tunicata TaxID=314281 RepID=UPI00273D543D|nr:thrombospondin type 3 repeat-containing protein [Pseudoalteromonas tunicata]MDP5212613.1 thrombospondin type 3 repeat-containing protein [Pseudoalteromonas tunicata]
MLWTSPIKNLKRLCHLLILSGLIVGCSKSDNQTDTIEPPVDAVVYQQGIELEDPHVSLAYKAYSFVEEQELQPQDLISQTPIFKGVLPYLSYQLTQTKQTQGFYFSGYFYIDTNSSFLLETGLAASYQLIVNQRLVEQNQQIHLAKGYHLFEVYLVRPDEQIQPRILLTNQASNTVIDLAQQQLFLPQSMIAVSLSNAPQLNDPHSGFAYQYVEATNLTLDSLHSYEITETANVGKVTANVRNRNDDYGVTFSGMMDLEQATLVSFLLNSNFTTQLQIDNEIVIGPHSLSGSVTQSIWLSAGRHQVTLSQVVNQHDLTSIPYLSLSWAKIQSDMVVFEPLSDQFIESERVVVEVLEPSEPDEHTEPGVNFRYFTTSTPNTIEQALNHMPNRAGRLDSMQANPQWAKPYSIFYQAELDVTEDGIVTFYFEDYKDIDVQLAGKTIFSSLTSEIALKPLNQVPESIVKAPKIQKSYFVKKGRYKIVILYSVGVDGLVPTIKIALPNFLVRLLEYFGFLAPIVEPDTDLDGDGVRDADDAFPEDPTESKDSDGDGRGDNSDNDRDGDGVENDDDALPDDPNEQSDLDNDGIGDNSDPDIDGDGVINEQDDFPYDATETLDTDGDSVGDNADPDRDNDGIPNELDAFPLDNSEWSDLDGDGIGDNSDTDRDGDGVANNDDAFPDNANETSDLDGDGIGDNSDLDRDGDGVLNEFDQYPDDPSKWSDNPELEDRDGDGIPNSQDVFPDDPSEWADTDKDGIGNNSDPDIDGDGVINENDAFPLDSSETSDIDADGIGDNSDIDRDGDSFNNELDAFPNDPLEWADLDGDGIGNNQDIDRDGDGIDNSQDIFPDNKNEWADLDGDGIGDNSDLDRDGDGFDNNDDAFPNDPTRWLKAVDVRLVSEINSQGVMLNWFASDSDNVTGFILYRADYSGEFAAIAQLPATQFSHQDSSLIADRAYRYMLKSVSNDNTLGQSATIYVLNLTAPAALSNLVLTHDGNTIDLSWSEQSGVNYQVARKQNNSWQLLNTLTTAQFRDSNLQYDIDYQYRVRAVKTIINPFDKMPYQAMGEWFESEQVLLKKALSIDFFNAHQRQGNQISWFISKATSEITIEGQLNNGDASNQLILTSGVFSTKLTVQNARPFSISLDLTQGKEWHLAVDNNPKWQQDLTLVFNHNSTKPIITPDALELAAATDTISLHGTVKSEASLKQMYAFSDRFPSSSFNLMTSAQGDYQAHVPLKEGLNLFTLVAVDRLEQQAQVQVKVIQSASQKPIIKLISHTDQQILSSSSVNLVADIFTQLPIDGLTSWLNGNQNGQLSFVKEGHYRLNFATLQLTEGDNNVEVMVKSVQGTSIETIKLIYLPLATMNPPSLQFSSPTPGSWLNQSSFFITGIIASEVPPILKVNGKNVSVYQESLQRYRFSYAAEQAEQTWIFIASNDSGDTEQEVNYLFDTQAPQLQLTQNWPKDSVVELVNNPVTISGLISDQQAVTLTINDAVINLTPGSQSNQYEFKTDVSLPKNESLKIDLVARDFAGNSTEFSTTVVNKSTAKINIIAPREQQEFVIDDQSLSLQLVASIENSDTNNIAKVSIDNQTSVDVPIVAGYINTPLPVAVSDSTHTLLVQVYDKDGTLSGQSSVQFTVKTKESIPLQIIATAPQTDDKQAEANGFIAFYFNKAVAQSDISVEVYETLHGKTYIDTSDITDTYLDQPGYKLQDVNRDNELITGALSSLPGDHSYAFYPDREFGYGASVQVNIKVKDQQMARFAFKVESLPTLIQGNIKDQLFVNVANVSVEIKELGIITTTDDNGIYSFGYGTPELKNLETGTYTIEFNGLKAQADFGNFIKQVELTQGSEHNLSVTQLPFIAKNVPFAPIASFLPKSEQAAGDIIFDLSQAQINHKGRSSLMMQFTTQNLTSSGLSFGVDIPVFYLMAGQPQGITVSGDVSLSITPASFMGNYNYLPPNGEYVPLLARKHRTNKLIVVGVAKLNNYILQSQGPVHLEILDYIGFGRVHPEKQPLLHQYALGELSLKQLQALLN